MRDRGELVAIVSMDLSKAFLSKLRTYGMDDASCALFRNSLSVQSYGR